MSATGSNEFRPFTSPEARERYLAHYARAEASWPVEFEARTVLTDDGATFVRVSGPADARPLVLLPGGQSNSLIWRRLIGPLSVRFRTYALDAIYDAGRSVPARPMKDVGQLTAWIDDVLDGLGLADGVGMMGMSYGAYVAAEYAMHAPHRLHKVVWLSPVMIAAPISKEFLDRLFACMDGSRASLEAFSRWIMPAVAALGEHELAARVDHILLIRESYGLMIPPTRGLALSDDDLRGIDVPALYITGERDGACENPAEAAARVGRLVPRVEIVLVPGASHDALVAEPQMVADRVIRFLEG